MTTYSTVCTAFKKIQVLSNLHIYNVFIQGIKLVISKKNTDIDTVVIMTNNFKHIFRKEVYIILNSNKICFWSPKWRINNKLALI